MITRRDLIASVAIALGLQNPASAGYVANESLSTIARRHARFFGAAVRLDQLDADAQFRAAILAQCSHITPELALKWASIEPSYGALDFANIDALTTFASVNNKKVRGHTLLWYASVPDWLAPMLREKPDWSIVRRYFGSVIPRYGDVIEQWDVVNEPIDTGHRMDGLRQNVFLDAFGPDYIPRALAEARSFAPGAQLMINEYGLEYDLIEERDRRYLLLKLLERLKNRGAPLDGLGLQGHLDLRKGTISVASVADFLKEVTAMGLFVVVTELDVKESNYAATPEARDRAVGAEVRRYLDVVLQHADVRGIATWGLSDRYSWLTVTKDDFDRFPGAWSTGNGPGLNRGLPLDASLNPTPMFYAVANALAT